MIWYEQIKTDLLDLKQAIILKEFTIDGIAKFIGFVIIGLIVVFGSIGLVETVVEEFKRNVMKFRGRIHGPEEEPLFARRNREILNELLKKCGSYPLKTKKP